MKKVSLLICGTMLMVILSGCGSNTASKTETIVTMDVNPSIQFELNQDDEVVGISAGNEDAKKILEKVDVEDDDANKAVDKIVDSLVDEGHLSTENNTVLLSVDNDDDDKRIELEQKLGETIQSSLKENSIDGAIFSQDMDIDDDVESLIKKYDISYGKATLIEKILDENDDNQKAYKVEDLVKLNAQELIMIYQSMERKDDDDILLGSVSTSKYITSDEALAVALSDAGLAQNQITDLEIDYDIENGVLTYEIEFKGNGKEYEYEINASKGVIEREIESASSSPATPAVTPNASSNSGGGNYDDSDYGPNNDGVTNYDDTDYGPNNDGVTNYDDTDYGPNNDGVTNYDDTDYGPNNDGVTDYDDNDDDGDTNYDDTDYDD
ncbi:MAG TPA: PepSY domain-containing protein [Candidatus Erysipelatoclostridium merdavium]|uniref:PepSY domain-containing protein n=1 Tax=Candidatus Erysipelatoclostridium merdavium TaxID=2838566 RepID=A0A9D1XMZ8_9FIRM|nr:PepSY domain-containing protein [Candidatus Erysipelatoclostridium merdavium]